MTQHNSKLDNIDTRLIAELQADGGLSQRALAERVGLSQNACHRRIQKLTASGILKGTSARVDTAALGLDLTVFMLVRTRNHTSAWADRFGRRAGSIPEITELHRVGGEWDYLLKVVTSGMRGYDRVYQALTKDLEFETVTGVFAMETILENRPIAVPRGV